MVALLSSLLFSSLFSLLFDMPTKKEGPHPNHSLSTKKGKTKKHTRCVVSVSKKRNEIFVFFVEKIYGGCKENNKEIVEGRFGGWECGGAPLSFLSFGSFYIFGCGGCIAKKNDLYLYKNPFLDSFCGVS